MIAPATLDHRNSLARGEAAWKSVQSARKEFNRKTVWLAKYDFPSPDDDRNTVYAKFYHYLEACGDRSSMQFSNHFSRWIWFASKGDGVTEADMLRYCLDEALRNEWYHLRRS